MNAALLRPHTQNQPPPPHHCTSSTRKYWAWGAGTVETVLDAVLPVATTSPETSFHCGLLTTVT